MAKTLRGFKAHVADMVGVTEAGLDCLARAVAADGVACGQGHIRGQGARAKLESQGFVVRCEECGWLITSAGREVVARARRLGY